MARRRQEIALQTEVETQEEWNDTINKEGLTVVDVYQAWAGPCKSVEGNFKRIKLETGEQMLKFALAKADTIDSLEKHRGKCEPCFLFYASGVLVDAVVGANAPELQKKIMSNLEKEKKILKEGGERTEFHFEHEQEEEEEADNRAASSRFRSPSIVNAIASQQYTLAVIRPDAYAEGKTEEIVDQIQQNGFKILIQQEHHLNEHDARELHRHKMNEEDYEEHIKKMTSGPSVVLLLQKTDAKDSSVEDFREFVNGQESWKTIIDCTQSADNIQGELSLLLPRVTHKSQAQIDKPLERTVAIVRPSAVKLFKDAIIKRIEDNGFEVTRISEIQLTEAQAEEFYAEKKDKPYYKDLIQEMTSGSSLALYLIKKDAIQHFRTLLGPAEKSQIKDAMGTFRNEFDIVDAKINSLHGPKSQAEVNRNIKFFFEEERILAILKPNLTEPQKSEIEGMFRKAGFFIMARKTETLTSEQVAKLEHSHRSKDYYDELVQYLTSNPSTLLVLAKDNASNSWKNIVGPEEPAKATETEPTSIRSIYGKDLVHNAIDIISNKDETKDAIDFIFGDIDADEKA